MIEKKQKKNKRNLKLICKIKGKEELLIQKHKSNRFRKIFKSVSQKNNIKKQDNK